MKINGFNIPGSDDLMYIFDKFYKNNYLIYFLIGVIGLFIYIILKTIGLR